MWFCRFFLFKFYESPKNLLARGYKDRAVDSLNKIASFNGSEDRISVNELCHDTGDFGGAEKGRESGVTGEIWFRTFLEKLTQFGPTRLKPLFSTKKMGWTTAIIWFLWIDIQIGSDA
jgi:hypothetical protein